MKLILKTRKTVSHRILPAIMVISVITGCSLNKMFLEPTSIPSNVKSLTLTGNMDTTVVVFSGDSHQPTFLKGGKTPIDFDFKIESVVFKSSNGNILNGWILKPLDEAPLATLLHFHGNGGFLLSQYSSMTPLIKYGFQIFVFDYSGFGFSEGEATRQNILSDAYSALDFIKSRPDLNSTKIVIYGQSLGGNLAAVVAEQRQAEIDALVIEGAFSSHKDIAAKSAGIFGRMFVSEQYAAYKSVKAYKKPVLIIHSAEDETIPFKMGQKIFDNANSPKELYEISKCHMCGPRFYPEEISEKIKKMLLPE